MSGRGKSLTRIGTMNRLIGLCLTLLVAVMMSPHDARAENIKLAGFFGTFKGNGVSQNKDSIYFGITVRDLDVKIEPAGDGFAIEWKTVMRRGGDPNNPNVRQKAQRMVFAPTGQAGVYRAADNGDLLSGQPYSWAHIRNASLIIHIMTIDRNGAYEMQSYTRTLEPTGMSFVFERIKNDAPVRTVKGKLAKFAN
jgi:hypothetical protein